MKQLKQAETLEIDVLEYLQQWVDEESWNDLAVMIMNGDDELASHHMVGTGAIDPDTCYPYARKTEQEVIRLAKQFRKLSHDEQISRYRECFKDCVIISCDDCNCVSFIHSSNEVIYPETLTECWECRSKNIQVKRGIQ